MTLISNNLHKSVKRQPETGKTVTIREYLMPFLPIITGPLRERERESQTNKEFHLGAKEFEYIPTLEGHAPTVDYPAE